MSMQMYDYTHNTTIISYKNLKRSNKRVWCCSCISFIYLLANLTLYKSPIVIIKLKTIKIM